MKSTVVALTWVASLEESGVSVFPHLSSPWHLEEDVASVSLSHPASSGPFPTLLSAASAPSHAPALFPSPSPSVGAPSHGDLSPSLGPGAAPGGPVHAPVQEYVGKDSQSSRCSYLEVES